MFDEIGISPTNPPTTPLLVTNDPIIARDDEDIEREVDHVMCLPPSHSNEPTWYKNQLQDSNLSALQYVFTSRPRTRSMVQEEVNLA